MAEKEKINRRLAAVLAADVVGYSRMMGADEEGTHAALKELLTSLFNPEVERNNGHIIKTMGDGVLVEFASAVDAVRCALNVQRSVEERNAGLPGERRMEFRIGINVGDLIVEGGDVFGDGVNIAARLEPLAKPGSICLSGGTYQYVKGKLALEVDDMGEQHLKNIAEPVRVYEVRPGVARAPTSTTTINRPSIAVLPFANLSGDSEQEYFADGMVDEIITGLSRLGWLYVVARTSSFTFKGKNAEIRDIAKRLEVRYVLEGSVRKGGDRVRIISQLTDAATGANVWADRFEGGLDDIFALQDQITERVVNAIQPSVLSAEIRHAKRKHPDNLDSYDLYLRALPLLFTHTHASAEEARRLLEEALALDPSYAPSLALASWSYMYNVVNGGSRSPDEDTARGTRLALDAISADSDDPMVLWYAPFVLASLGKDPDSACAIVEHGVELYPTDVVLLGASGYILTLTGDQEKALERFEAALRLAANNPLAFHDLAGAAIACTLLGRYSKAVDYAEQSHKRNQSFGVTYRILAAAHAQLGNVDKAAQAMARYRALDPEATINQLKIQLPYGNPQQAERLWEGLRKAGLPE